MLKVHPLPEKNCIWLCYVRKTYSFFNTASKTIENIGQFCKHVFMQWSAQPCESTQVCTYMCVEHSLEPHGVPRWPCRAQGSVPRDTHQVLGPWKKGINSLEPEDSRGGSRLAGKYSGEMWRLFCPSGSLAHRLPLWYCLLLINAAMGQSKNLSLSIARAWFVWSAPQTGGGPLPKRQNSNFPSPSPSPRRPLYVTIL